MKCKHEIISVKVYLSGWDDYIYDTRISRLEFSDSGHRKDRVAASGVCMECGKTVRGAFE